MRSAANSSVTKFFKGDIAVAIGGSLLCMAITLALPAYYPLLQPDSGGYMWFDSSRTALYPLFLRGLLSAGLSLDQVIYAQAVIFHVALVFLLLAMLRAGCRRALVVVFVIALAANVGFSSIHWTILTESMFSSFSVVMVALLLDYLRTGRLAFIAGAGTMAGILYGIRPAGLTVLPMLILAVWLKWRDRDCSAFTLVATLVITVAIGPAIESFAFRVEHPSGRVTIVPYILMGKAAMLVQNDMTFSGPHADTLNKLQAELYKAYAPVHKFLSNIPSIVAWPAVSSTYEGVAQFSVLNNALAKASDRTGLSQAWLRDQLGIQAIEKNFGGYMQLSLLNYFGQWSVTALTFPPAARAFNDYVDKYSEVPFERNLSSITLHPHSYKTSYLIYPAFLMMGVLSLVLSLLIAVMLWMPRPVGGTRLYYLMIAGCFAAMCQVHTIIISFINVATPRFLMAVYPQLLLMLIFLFMAALPNVGISKRVTGEVSSWRAS